MVFLFGINGILHVCTPCELVEQKGHCSSTSKRGGCEKRFVERPKSYMLLNIENWSNYSETLGYSKQRASIFIKDIHFDCFAMQATGTLYI